MFKTIIESILSKPYLSLFFVILIALYGWHARQTASVDAIPDIGQNQVIVLTKWEGQSPKDIEDQITYPLSVALLSVPKAESVRGKSLFGFSFVQVTFSDESDYYWARSRVSEQLSTVAGDLPDGANPILGPDSTGLGQIFYYTLESEEPRNPADLRSLQDYVIKYALESIEGVSEVASIGGYKKEYQVDLDPNKLRFHKVPLRSIVQALKDSNKELGAKTLEQSDMELIIRAKGFLGGGKGNTQTLKDIESTVISSKEGIPLRIKDLADVSNGTSFRRGALDLNGAEAVGGIVVMRLGENPRAVIERLKEKIQQLEPSLQGVKINPVYDRTELIDETVDTLTTALNHEIWITILIIFLFLIHIRTSLIVASILPLSVLVIFIVMKHLKLDLNIMSLAGIAIAIGNMVDLGIVIAENIYRNLSNKKEEGLSFGIKNIVHSVGSVAPALVTATATTVISFLPVFFLTGRDYKLFSPLAMTKTIALLSALIVALIIVPLFSRVFLLKKFKPTQKNYLTRFIYKTYEPLVRWSLAHRKFVLSLPFLVFALGLFSWKGSKVILDPIAFLTKPLGLNFEESSIYKSIHRFLPGLRSDDWIALDEGSMFYMPTMYPGVSFSKALEILQTQDVLIKEIPEVENVLGKIGRADSALDPAPTAMVETYIMLKDKSKWREGFTEQDIWSEVTKKATLPGVTPASYLQPIEGRVIMLQSGIKASMAIRIYGDDLEGLAEASEVLSGHLKNLNSVDMNTVNPDIVLGKPYLEFEVDRQAAARYGMSVREVNELIATALGGQTISTTFEARERYPIRLRYQREYRNHLELLEKLPIQTKKGETIPLKVLSKMTTSWGPSGISSENARLVAHVAFTPSGEFGALETVRQVEESLKKAQDSGHISLPKGYELELVGSFQNQIEANKKLMWIIPLVILLNLFIIYLLFQKWILSLLIFSSIPLAFGGAMFLLAILGIKINTAIWVGMIALFGIAVDNGILLTRYLEESLSKANKKDKKDIEDSIVEASLKRIRPCLMTTATTVIALTPILFSSGRGAELARSMALPLFGGMFTALLVLLVLPAAYASLMGRGR